MARSVTNECSKMFIQAISLCQTDAAVNVIQFDNRHLSPFLEVYNRTGLSQTQLVRELVSVSGAAHATDFLQVHIQMLIEAQLKDQSIIEWVTIVDSRTCMLHRIRI